MPSSSNRKIRIKKTRQISEDHCGPAVLQMLLSNLDIKVTQKRIAQAAGVTRKLRQHGIRIDQMAKSITKMKMDAQIWYKENASVEDIDNLLTKYSYPVGVEWQGLFYHSEQEEEEGYDYGHYSIITRVDRNRGELIMVDPYRDFAHQDRIMSISQFERRWWDTNEIEGEVVTDKKLLFVVIDKNDPKPSELGLKPVNFVD